MAEPQDCVNSNMNNRGREVTKIYHSSWILPIVLLAFTSIDFGTDAKLKKPGLKTGGEKSMYLSEKEQENGVRI